MSKINDAVKQLHTVDAFSRRDTILTRVHPAGKLLITVLYLAALLSFPVRNLTGVFGMAVYLVILYQMGDLSVKYALKHLWGIFILLFLVGIANPLLDREIAVYWGGLPVSSGMLSFVTLFLKGAFALLAAYGLLASTGMDNLCYGFQCLHMPRLLIVVIMLIYRYIILFLKEAQRRTLAYSMRAPGQKGIHFKAWGSLAGSMLLGSIDRAELVYESMQLRGFQGQFFLSGIGQWKRRYTYVFCIVMAVLILCFRVVPVFQLIGVFFE